ncbi:hypothetical protein D9757_015006 [Collybiopsis confluens]|uniref:Uncharacterized protein n=1 Tax=Collybiopsis confluens TaxID=2823264 RepID=A0A8H5FJ36_9AGAR|nr:hypothetical protein D9757_015006 [Collybiopsis confluens]
MKWKKEYTPVVQALAGGSKFTINGGHFNVVGGNVYSYSEEGPNKDSSWNRDEFIKIFKQHLQSRDPTDIGQGFFDSLMYEKERKENFIIRSSGWRSCRVQSPTNNLNTEACQHLQTPMATNACGMSQNEDGSSDRIADSSAQFRTEAIANVVLGSELEPTTKAKRSRKRRIRKNKHQQYPKSEYNLNDLLFGTLSPRGSLGNPELVPIPSLNVQVPPIIGDTAVSSSTGLFQEAIKSIGIALPNYQGVADAKKTATTISPLAEKFDFGNTSAMLSSSCQTTTSGMVAGVVSPEPAEPQESCESNKYCKISLPSTAEEIKVSGSAIQTADRDVHSTTTHSKCVNTTFNNYAGLGSSIEYPLFSQDLYISIPLDVYATGEVAVGRLLDFHICSIIIFRHPPLDVLGSSGFRATSCPYQRPGIADMLLTCVGD